MSATTFVCAGDVMITRADPESMLRHVAGYFQKADVAYVNLEGPTCDVGEPEPGYTAGIGIPLKSSTRTARALADAGIDVVSLANNHTMDYGVAGLEQTIDLLDQARIAHTGAGRNLDEARRPAFLEAMGLRLAFLSYASVCLPSFAAGANTPGLAMIRIKTTYEANPRLILQPGSPMKMHTSGEAADVAMLINDVKAAKSVADLVIVAWHWGVSDWGVAARGGNVVNYQRDLGKAVIDAGASAIIGHHAHKLTGIEFYRGCPIFYGLGNFAFELGDSSFRRETAIVSCEISREGVHRVAMIPMLINDRHEPVPLGRGRDVQKIAWYLEHASEGMNTRFIDRGDHIELAGSS